MSWVEHQSSALAYPSPALCLSSSWARSGYVLHLSVHTNWAQLCYANIKSRVYLALRASQSCTSVTAGSASMPGDRDATLFSPYNHLFSYSCYCLRGITQSKRSVCAPPSYNLTRLRRQPLGHRQRPQSPISAFKPISVTDCVTGKCAYIWFSVISVA